MRKAPFTFFLIIVTALLFFWNQSYLEKGFSPLEKNLFFDYTAFDDLLARYEKTPTEKTLSELGHTSFWPGLYNILVLKENELPQSPYPLGEKIAQGEIWRLFSPILLHAHLFHLFFNVLWLFFFGTIVEQKIGTGRYIFLILLTALVSNLSQYAMSGPHFLGLSGVLMGLAGFVFARKKKAPEETWPIPRATLLMVFWVITLLASLQTVFFVLDITGLPTFSTFVANTAHISGALTGLLCGLIPFFKERPYERT